KDGNLTQNISILRKVLSDGGHQYIQTVPRRGYRFVGYVQELDETELIIEERSLARMVVEEHRSNAPRIIQTASLLLPATNFPRLRRHLPLSHTWALISLAMIGVAIAIAYFAFISRSKDKGLTTVSNNARSIAVLPFQNLTANSGDQFLGLGMTDALISRLTNIRQANVRPTSAVQKYSVRQQDAAAIGKELRVDSILDGTVQKDGDR